MTLEDIAKKMCAKGKGILAADESTGTIAKRFKSINVENTELNRLAFRETLFKSEAIKNYIGGIILFDETIRQKTSSGLSIPELIVENGSKDKTREILKSKKNPNCYYLFEDHLDKYRTRGERLERYRNKIIEKIKSEPKLRNCDLFIILDLDDTGEYRIDNKI